MYMYGTYLYVHKICIYLIKYAVYIMTTQKKQEHEDYDSLVKFVLIKIIILLYNKLDFIKI
jgi:hypothetical protein